MGCGPLPDPANGVVDLTGGTEFGNSAQYSCDDGYIINGTSTRDCLATGSWSGEEPTCDKGGERCVHMHQEP